MTQNIQRMFDWLQLEAPLRQQPCFVPRSAVHLREVVMDREVLLYVSQFSSKFLYQLTTQNPGLCKSRALGPQKPSGLVVMAEVTSGGTQWRYPVEAPCGGTQWRYPVEVPSGGTQWR